LKRVIIILSTIVSIIYGQIDFGYNPKSVSPKVKSIVKHFDKAERVEGRALGRIAIPSKIYPYFTKLRNSATVAELFELTKHPNPITRYYSFMALSYRHTGGDTLYPIVLDHILDTATVLTQFGCIGSHSSMSNYGISIYTSSKYINPTISQLKTIDSLIIKYKIDYRFFPVSTFIIRKDSLVLKDSLIGEWGINSTILENQSDTITSFDSITFTRKTTIRTGGTSISCYSCPKVIFNSDFTAIIKYPNGDKENFKWSLIFDKLTISDIPTNSVFYATEYQLIFTQKKEYIELELFEKEKGYAYILGR
jgi:hypothetical protein